MFSGILPLKSKIRINVIPSPGFKLVVLIGFRDDSLVFLNVFLNGHNIKRVHLCSKLKIMKIKNHNIAWSTVGRQWLWSLPVQDAGKMMPCFEIAQIFIKHTANAATKVLIFPPWQNRPSKVIWKVFYHFPDWVQAFSLEER